MHQQSGQIARQNTSRLLRVNRARVAELVQQVVEVGPTTEDLQRFIDVISQGEMVPKDCAVRVIGYSGTEALVEVVK